MGYLIQTKRSKLFNEFTSDEQKKYFDLKVSKYLPHVDTLYYSIFIKGDEINKEYDVKDEDDFGYKYDEDDFSHMSIPERIDSFVSFLDFIKKQFDSDKETLASEYWYDYDESLLFSKRRFSIYDYCIRREGDFDIFISKYLPNNSTPRIVVQLRSIGLWGVGEYELVNDSFRVVKKILDRFGLEIDRCQENRIDFCYHTNILQSPEKMYNDDCLANNLHTTFSIYSKVGRKNGKKLTVEYLSLGQRSSNNVFFRSYNKVREVIEENYKDFFLEVWRGYGLINYYDFFVYSYAFEKKSYNAIYEGMIEFYLLLGKDKTILKQFRFIKEHIKDYSIDELKNIVLSVCPSPTLVINIEFQVMRKFFHTFDAALDKFAPQIDHECDCELFRIFQILDNRKLFLEYLTRCTVSFEKDVSFDEKKEMIENDKESIYLDFWKRLRRVKLDSCYKGELYRSYTKNLNRDLIVSRIKGLLATLSLYDGNFDSDITDDMSSLITVLNDNDMILKDDGTYKIIDQDYTRIKENKKKALKSILEKNAIQDLSKNTSLTV